MGSVFQFLGLKDLIELERAVGIALGLTHAVSYSKYRVDGNPWVFSERSAEIRLFGA